MNRITNAIDKLNRVIPERIAQGLTTQELVDSLHKTLDMSLVEYCKFQNLKSAYTGSLLTLDEAQTVYGFLGHSVEKFNAQPIAVKSVYAGSSITMDEAQTVYGFLGNTVEHFNAQPIAVKSVLTQLFMELIEKTIK